MRNKYGIIVFVLIILLIIGEIALFFTKNNVASFFNNREDLASLTGPVKITVPANVLDDSIIKSNIFKSLKNNVSNFEYVNICKRPAVPIISVIKTVVVQNVDGTEATSTPAANIDCQQGNNNPFLVKKK